MKCIHCAESKMKPTKIDYTVEIPGGPSLLVKGVEVFQCSECKDTVVDSAVSAKINKLALSSLFVHYWSLERTMTGAVAMWIRKAIGMSNVELAKLSGQSPSAITQADKRNSTVDSLAKLYLLTKTADFVTGSNIGSDWLKKFMAQVQTVVHERANADAVEYLEATA